MTDLAAAVPHGSRSPRRVLRNTAPLLVAVASILFGCLILIGPRYGAQDLERVAPAPAATVPAVAFAFILSGASLWAASAARIHGAVPAIARMCAGFIAVLALASLPMVRTGGQILALLSMTVLAGIIWSAARALSAARRERIRAEEEIWRIGAFLDSIVENIPNMIFVKDARELRFVRFNKAGEELLGYSREELIGKNDYDFFPKQEADFFTGKDREVLASKELRDISEEPIETRLKGRRALHTKKVPILDPDGEPQYLLGISEDITELKEAQEERLRQAQRLESVGRLAGGVAHDFNNLLTAIMGYTELVSRRLRSDDEVSRDAEEIMKAATRASMLTRQLLVFSRREVVQPRVLDLNVIVADIGSMLRRLIGADVELVVRPGADLGAVMADSGQIEQVIMNLVVNARDAMPQGGTITIETANVDPGPERTRAPHGSPSAKRVLLAVSDTGIGMNEAVQARMFEPFFTTKGPDRGTGLGLSTVRGIVEQCGGEVRFRSKVGRGTTFEIYIPRVEGAHEDRRPVRNLDDAPRGAETILVVEDQDAVAAVMRGALTLCGYRVLGARNGLEALQILGEGAPVHIMVTDVVMPRMGGFDLVERALAIRPELKILYVSGYLERGFSGYGALDPQAPYLQKPFMPEVLASKVREVLDAKRSAFPPPAMPSPT